MTEHTRKRSHTPKAGCFSTDADNMRKGTSPQQVPGGPQHVQLTPRSPSMTSKSPDLSFLGGRPTTSTTSSSQAIVNKQATFIAQSRASMKGSPLIAHYLGQEDQHTASPTGRERTITVSFLSPTCSSYSFLLSAIQ